MKILKQYHVFIASPGDVTAERGIVREVCDTLNKKPLVRERGIALDPVGWEDVAPAAGRPQEIINRLVRDCDLFVLIFHKRFGTPTGEAASGSLEEFLLAYEKWKDLKKPHIMVYFNDGNFSHADFNDPQVQKVNEFRNRIDVDKSLLYSTFASSESFKKQVSGHLEEWIVQRPSVPVPDEQPPPPKPLAIPESYKGWIVDRCKYMDIDRLREKSDVIQVRLPEIYIPLKTQPLDPSKGKAGELEMRIAEPGRQAVDVEQLIAGNAYLVIKGDAGSGKTTLVKHVAYTIIRAENAHGLNGYLPVVMFLKDLKAFQAESDAPEAVCCTADALLEFYFQKVGHGLGLETVAAYCQANRAIFLIDGLDEIDGDTRKSVVNALADFRVCHEAAKMVLTGRPHGVDQAVVDRFDDRIAQILPFDMAQVEAFISRWFRFVSEEDSRFGNKSAEEMLSEIKAHPGTANLIDNPLMLTAICILYQDGRELPGQRAELYKKFINNLLYRRFRAEQEKVHGFLKTLAHEMFTAGERGIDRRPAVNLLSAEYPQRESETATAYRNRLQLKFDAIEPNCGLLMFQEGQYNFRHLTLQEYLAATAIIDRETDYLNAIKAYWKDPRYAELITLYIGFLSIENKRMANKIVEDALGQDDERSISRWCLAARALLDMHPDRREIDVVDLATEKLRFIINAHCGTKVRCEAAETLGRLGDRRDMEAFVQVPAGQYETSTGPITMDAVEMGKYPVTNQWFAKFIAQSGYQNPAWWSPQGRKWRNHTNASHPAFWHDRQWNCPNAPVVGVCWYEADAFTRWLTRTREDGYGYCLPDEKEWEAAAAGFEKRPYPWGKNWGENRCNSSESKLEKISPVGVFKQGDTPEGLSDMAGNVWEWTRSDYHHHRTREDFRFDQELQKLFDEREFEDLLKKLEEKDRQLPVLRGGSWVLGRAFARCAYRNRLFPLSRSHGIGFRCVRIKN